ncbi:hypothetical protein DFH07DRAFT_768301 [Mycena maculata]|uniref:Uncharacterized protein n=1 Tax=Mycena maculata TaxID=230809 RepID=A0AAD7JX65_9AGAR|nr:hypothetical protein DFH07DRAFT_768301 [Mycena maculata]
MSKYEPRLSPYVFHAACNADDPGVPALPFRPQISAYGDRASATWAGCAGSMDEYYEPARHLPTPYMDGHSGSYIGTTTPTPTRAFPSMYEPSADGGYTATTIGSLRLNRLTLKPDDIIYYMTRDGAAGARTGGAGNGGLEPTWQVEEARGVGDGTGGDRARVGCGCGRGWRCTKTIPSAMGKLEAHGDGEARRRGEWRMTRPFGREIARDDAGMRAWMRRGVAQTREAHEWSEGVGATNERWRLVLRPRRFVRLSATGGAERPAALHGRWAGIHCRRSLTYRERVESAFVQQGMDAEHTARSVANDGAAVRSPRASPSSAMPVPLSVIVQRFWMFFSSFSHHLPPPCPSRSDIRKQTTARMSSGIVHGQPFIADAGPRREERWISGVFKRVGRESRRPIVHVFDARAALRRSQRDFPPTGCPVVPGCPSLGLTPSSLLRCDSTPAYPKIHSSATTGVPNSVSGSKAVPTTTLRTRPSFASFAAPDASSMTTVATSLTTSSVVPENNAVLVGNAPKSNGAFTSAPFMSVISPVFLLATISLF